MAVQTLPCLSNSHIKPQSSFTLTLPHLTFIALHTAQCADRSDVHVSSPAGNAVVGIFGDGMCAEIRTLLHFWLCVSQQVSAQQGVHFLISSRPLKPHLPVKQTATQT